MGKNYEAIRQDRQKPPSHTHTLHGTHTAGQNQLPPELKPLQVAF